MQKIEPIDTNSEKHSKEIKAKVLISLPSNHLEVVTKAYSSLNMSFEILKKM